MVKTAQDSVIEVWGYEYINNPQKRQNEDEHAEIIQIEHGYNDDYMVEVIRHEE